MAEAMMSKVYYAGVVWLKIREMFSKADGSRKFAGSYAEKLVARLGILICAFLFSNASVFGEYAPFGVSLAAAVPFPYVFFSFVGSAIGYIVFPTPSGGFRYIAAAAVVIAIRWTLSDIKKLNEHPLYAAAVAFVPVFATGFAVMSVSGFTTAHIVMHGAEALLAAAAASFISRTAVILAGTRSLGMLVPQEIASLILTGCIGLLALSGFRLYDISIGRTAAIMVILYAARYGGIQGGAVAGIACGAVLGLAGSEFSFVGACFAFGGLMAGLFSSLGRIASCLVFLLAAVITSLQAGRAQQIVVMFYETVIASVIFMMIPEQVSGFLRTVFIHSQDDEHMEGLRRSIIMRLDFAAKALSHVSDDVEEVSAKLGKIITPTMDGVFENAVEQTCPRCGMKVFCWEHRDGVSMEQLRQCSDTLRTEGSIKPSDLCEEFRRRCCRTSEMSEAINRCYDSYIASQAARKRVDEVRQVVAGQFCGLGSILEEMAEEYSDYEIFDNDLSQRITVRLKEIGLQPVSVSARIDYLGRMTIEAALSDTDSGRVRRAQIMHEMNKISGRRFDTPTVTTACGTVRFTMCERPCFDVEIASSQHICGDGKLCGDHFSYFTDGTGKMTAILSDGMGTGGRAAVDGGMATGIMEKLIKAGLGFDCSLKVVNSALLVKSEDESLATLDIVSIDLYSGRTEFMKAGAALSFICKNRTMFRVETPSLPAGILPEIEFTCTEDELGGGDLIVMVSDGAIATGEDWIENLILSRDFPSMQQLADSITDEAITRRKDGHDDDITVIAMRIMVNSQ